MNLSERAKKALRYSAFGAVVSAAALSPLGFAGADPNAHGTPGAPVTVTATVTAVVAPDQCEPLPDGKLPQKAVDYASTGDPITPDPEAPVTDERADEEVPSTNSAEPTPSKAPKADDEDGKKTEQISGGNGPFDPYLCDPQAIPTTTTPVTPTVDPGPQLEDIPGVTPTLRPYPGSGSGLAENPEGGSGVELSPPDVEATPTENPTPRGGLAPSRPLN